eukprot:s44_g9.t1
MLKFRGESICMTAAGFMFNSLRRFTQILREMINDESDDPNYHKDISDTESLIQNRLKPYLEKECKKPTDLRHFCSTLHFAPVNFKDVETFRELHKCLQANANGLVDNRIFYLALPPFLFREAVKLIRQECWPGTGYVRVIVEKPFGHDLQSARDLASQLSEYLVESQVYRIDHYLAKNMVLNILALRFANRELGRLFHADNVSIVRITFKEDINVAGRAGYFDGYGIIRVASSVRRVGRVLRLVSFM